VRGALERLDASGAGIGRLVDRIAGVDLRNGKIAVALRAEPHEGAAMEPVRYAAQAMLRERFAPSDAVVTLTSDRAPPAEAANAPGQSSLPGIRHVIAVASGKGGVGKSTTACNLALGLRARGLRVGLLDADIYGPSAPTLFGLHGRPRVREGRILEPLDGFGVKVMSIGFVVDPETALVWRGPMVKSAVAQMLGEVAWGDLDVLVVDLPPGTGDAQLAIAQAVPLSGAVIVSTPQDLALIDARRAIAMFARLGVPILGLVENMSHFVCGTCGTRHAVFGEGGAQAEALRLGLPFLGAVPLVLALREASDAGRPVAALDPDGPVGRIYHGMAEAVASGLDRVQQRSRDP